MARHENRTNRATAQPTTNTQPTGETETALDSILDGEIADANDEPQDERITEATTVQAPAMSDADRAWQEHCAKLPDYVKTGILGIVPGSPIVNGAPIFGVVTVAEVTGAKVYKNDRGGGSLKILQGSVAINGSHLEMPLAVSLKWGKAPEGSKPRMAPATTLGTFGKFDPCITSRDAGTLAGLQAWRATVANMGAQFARHQAQLRARTVNTVNVANVSVDTFDPSDLGLDISL